MGEARRTRGGTTFSGDASTGEDTGFIDMILGRYRPLETMGTGGFGTVELAYDQRLQRKVAIKRLPLNPDSPEKTPGLTEARTAGHLTNPHIVSVYDFATDDEYAYIVMEYVDGPTLTQMIGEEGGFLDLDEVACVVRDVGNALTFAHKNHVLHLDVKPDNILITPDGVVKVTDFGIAVLAGSSGFGYAQGGTLGYMPPEQIVGDPVDERTDVWAFASVVYETLTGRNPFLSEDLDGSLEIIETGNIPPVTSFRSDVDPEIDDCLAAALSPSPEDRFENARIFTNTILELLGDPEDGQWRFNEILAPPEEEEEEEEEHLDHWERIGDKGAAVHERIFSLISCAWLAWIASSVAQLPSTAILTITGAVGLAALFVPMLGTALTIIVLTACFFMVGCPVAGVATGVAGTVWWVLLGRKDRASCAYTFLLPAFLPFYLGFSVPLIEGFRMRTSHAFGSALFGSFLALVATALTGTASLLDCGFLPASLALEPDRVSNAVQTLIATPETWVIIAGWVVSAVLMAFLCGRRTKMVSMVGSVLGCAVMMLSVMFCAYLENGYLWASPEWEPVIMIGLAFVIMCIITALGAPYRTDAGAEEE